jgi:hypothetical protein
MSLRSYDLVAVQRDAALLDALALRARPERIDIDGRSDPDPVAGLLAALAGDVDDGPWDVAGPVAARCIPEQVGHRARRGTVSALPLAVQPASRRHVARAVAAMVVTATVLSISGVAAAVSGDPLTPYKRVIDVVRGGYDEVVPRGLVAPTAKAVPQRAKASAVTLATRAVGQTREAAGVRASRLAGGRRMWQRNVWERTRWGRRDRNRHGSGGREHDGSARGNTAGSGHNTSGLFGTGHGSRSGTGLDHHDIGGRTGQSWASRR